MSNSEVIKKIIGYLNSPSPLWENQITAAISQYKWNELKGKKIGIDNYSIEKCLSLNSDFLSKSFPIINLRNNKHIQLISPSSSVENFYLEHGIKAVEVNAQNVDQTIFKLKCAFQILKLEDSVFEFIELLLKSIYIIESEDKEIDISYSHPSIPFSIFLSICEDSSVISSLRVAESILHESMHLKLTLLENIIPLVYSNTGNVFFSPWRDEKRPAHGVLHGLFVFRGILDFFVLIKDYKEVKVAKGYIEDRIVQIKKELAKINDFATCIDLTRDGAILTANLLPLN